MWLRTTLSQFSVAVAVAVAAQLAVTVLLPSCTTQSRSVEKSEAMVVAQSCIRAIGKLLRLILWTQFQRTRSELHSISKPTRTVYFFEDDKHEYIVDATSYLRNDGVLMFTPGKAPVFWSAAVMKPGCDDSTFVKCYFGK